MRDAFMSEVACFERAYFLFSQKDLDGLKQLSKDVDALRAKLMLTNRAYIALKNLVAELTDILTEMIKNGGSDQLESDVCNEPPDGLLSEKEPAGNAVEAVLHDEPGAL